MKKFILLLLFCLMSKSAISQENRDYFPMEVGNKWYYVHSDPWMDKYGSIDSSLSIIGTESINDTLYFKFDESDFLSKHIRVWTNLLRKDSIGNIFGRIFGKDQLLFRVKYVPNDVWWVMDADTLKIIKIIAYTPASHDFPPMMLPFMHLLDTCFSFYATKCTPLYIGFRMWHWDDVTLTMTNNFGITGTGSNMYEQFRLIRFKTKDSIVTPRTFLFKDWGIKKNKFGFIITDLFDSNDVNYISLEYGKKRKLTPRLIFEP